jgi:hypothetical protein
MRLWKKKAEAKRITRMSIMFISRVLTLLVIERQKSGRSD